ncbi:hypothetical protein FE257_005556 [Aspergillus nanangensis]|uniref:FAD-binding FR-type domain-containing protein n=1 Tax=Aspergillus nanangensis TaxID=2582783 RepID=A0AAD4CQ67_ASPNN|nr:hypothetical protein FE257_005556 [Aspergillus nanangensis]
MHRWIGRAVVIHATLHGAIMILSDDKPAQAIQRYYVPFMMSRSKCFWYLLASVALWILSSVAALVMSLARCWRRSGPSVVISPFHKLLSIDVSIPSRWKVEAGQYVYIWLPHAGLRTAGQLSLFYVTSWDDTPGDDDTKASARGSTSWSLASTLVEAEIVEHDGEPPQSNKERKEQRSQRTLHILARPQSSILVAALYQAKSLHNVQHTALVLGPYGKPPDLGRFGIVLLIVEDIGITRVFSLIQTLVRASEQHRAIVRKLVIVWQMKDLDNRRWVNMQHLLDLDRQEFKILQFLLYYRQNRNNEPSFSPGSRVQLNRGSVDVEETVRGYLRIRRGSMLVGVCARRSVRDEVRAIVQSKMNDELRFMDIDVEPYHKWLDTDSAVNTAGTSHHLKWIASKIAEGRGYPS